MRVTVSGNLGRRRLGLASVLHAAWSQDRHNYAQQVAAVSVVVPEGNSAGSSAGTGSPLPALHVQRPRAPDLPPPTPPTRVFRTSAGPPSEGRLAADSSMLAGAARTILGPPTPPASRATPSPDVSLGVMGGSASASSLTFLQQPHQQQAAKFSALPPIAATAERKAKALKPSAIGAAGARSLEIMPKPGGDGAELDENVVFIWRSLPQFDAFKTVTVAEKCNAVGTVISTKEKPMPVTLHLYTQIENTDVYSPDFRLRLGLRRSERDPEPGCVRASATPVSALPRAAQQDPADLYRLEYRPREFVKLSRKIAVAAEEEVDEHGEKLCTDDEDLLRRGERGRDARVEEVSVGKTGNNGNGGLLAACFSPSSACTGRGLDGYNIRVGESETSRASEATSSCRSKVEEFQPEFVFQFAEVDSNPTKSDGWLVYKQVISYFRGSFHFAHYQDYPQWNVSREPDRAGNVYFNYIAEGPRSSPTHFLRMNVNDAEQQLHFSAPVATAKGQDAGGDVDAGAVDQIQDGRWPPLTKKEIWEA